MYEWDREEIFSGGCRQGGGDRQYGDISFSVRCVYCVREGSALVRIERDSYLAAGNLSDFYFYLRFCLGLGNGGKSAARSAVPFVWQHDLTGYAVRGSLAGDMVRHTEFYGERGFADVSSSQNFGRSFLLSGIYPLPFFVCFLQADTVRLYRVWGSGADTGARCVVLPENFHTSWISVSWVSLGGLFSCSALDIFVPVRLFFQWDIRET